MINRLIIVYSQLRLSTDISVQIQSNKQILSSCRLANVTIARLSGRTQQLYLYCSEQENKMFRYHYGMQIWQSMQSLEVLSDATGQTACS